MPIREENGKFIVTQEFDVGEVRRELPGHFILAHGVLGLLEMNIVSEYNRLTGPKKQRPSYNEFKEWFEGLKNLVVCEKIGVYLVTPYYDREGVLQGYKEEKEVEE